MKLSLRFKHREKRRLRQRAIYMSLASCFARGTVLSVGVVKTIFTPQGTWTPK
jgi:hypothetical protein